MCEVLAVTMIVVGLLSACGTSVVTDSKPVEETIVEEAKTAESEKKVLRVGVECSYAPFNWTQINEDIINGEKAVPIFGTNEFAYGYDVMMAQNVKAVRHQGLLVGVKLDEGINSVDVKKGCLNRKLLVTAIGTQVVRMVPPLILAKEDCDVACQILGEAITANA